MVAEVRRSLGAAERLARGCLMAIVAFAATGCLPATLDFSALDAAADATSGDETVAPPDATAEAFAGDDAGSPCSPDDPNCHPCVRGDECFGQCSPELHYCVECVDHCPYGNVCVANQCVKPCSDQNPCPHNGSNGEICDPTGFCRDCDFDPMCDSRHLCRRNSGTCVECLTAIDCVLKNNGNQCSVDFTCYFLAPTDDGGVSGTHDH